MLNSSIVPDHFAFPADLKSSAILQNLPLGLQLHASLTKLNYQSTPITVPNTLITMYSKCGDLENSSVFDKLAQRDQVSWNSLISAFCMFERWKSALEAFRAMQEENVEPSSFTLVSGVVAYWNLGQFGGVRLRKQVDGFGLEAGFYSDGKTFTYNALTATYVKLKRVHYSVELFDRFEGGDVVSWNTMVSSLVQSERGLEVLRVLYEMVSCGIKPDGVALSSVLPA